MVQRILRKRLSAGCGTPEYRTLWEGCPAAEATWEPAESFAGCRELLAAFERGLEPVVVAEVGVAVAGREIIGIVRREARQPAGSGAAAKSANDSDGEWRAAPRRKKAARRAGQAAAGGPSGAEEVAAGPADAPCGQGHGVAWEAQLARLAAYKAARGDCNVPNRWAEDPRLGTWVNTQRKGKRKMDRGEPSEGMTAARVAGLTALGFEWDRGRSARTIL